MRASILLLLLLSLTLFGQATKALGIYVIDVEGGNATLFDSPSGEAVVGACADCGTS